MDHEPILSLQCVRKNGRRERTDLTHHTLPQARELAKRLLETGSGLYAEVEICNEYGTLEVIHSSTVLVNTEVLLVEDNAGDAILVGQALEDCPTPVHLRIARDGEQALQILREPHFRPDLIILDLNIPGISGYGVLASDRRPKNTPVVVFSSSHNEADVGRAMSLGAKDFVHKPMNLDEYKMAVTGMVQKWAGHEARP